MALGLLVGLGCARLHDRLVRGLASLIIEGDETWSFIHTKQSRVDPAKHPAEWGDAYTYIGLDATAKLVISYLVGKRDEESANVFARDLRSRLTVVPHLSTDGFNAYPAAIAAHFARLDRLRRGNREVPHEDRTAGRITGTSRRAIRSSSRRPCSALLAWS